MKNHLPVSVSQRAGFTLVELLVTIAIIAVLTGAGLAGYRQIQAKSQRAVALQQMRQIGLTIPAYAADNNGRLPSPLDAGQQALYDPEAEGSFLVKIAPFLGLEEPNSPEVVGVFMPPAFKKTRINPETARTYVMNESINMGNGETLNPWGRLTPADPGSEEGGDEGADQEDVVAAVPLNRIPEDAWGFSDADQLHPRVITADWKSFTPTEEIHGKRLAWFFDGSISSVENEAVLERGRNRDIDA